MSFGGSYTNHAGNVIVGEVLGVERGRVAFTNLAQGVGFELPLSIFPEGERRRILEGAGAGGAPRRVRRAVDGARRMIERSRRRAELGLCSKEDHEKHRDKVEKAVEAFLRRAEESGEITKAERKALWR